MSRAQKQIAAAVGAALLCGVVVLVFATGKDAYKKLKSDNVDERLQAVRQLGGDGSGGATEALATATRDPAHRVACEAVVYLSRRAGPEEVGHLVESLADSRAPVRAAAAAGLGQFRLRNEVKPQPLINLLADTKEDATVRAAAANSLGVLERFEAMPALVAALDDPDELVRGRAGRAVREILGVDYGYRANDSEQERDRVIKTIRKQWPSYEQAHRSLIKRLEEKQK